METEKEKIAEEIIKQLEKVLKTKPYDTSMPVNFMVADICLRGMKTGDAMYFLQYEEALIDHKIGKEIESRNKIEDPKASYIG